MVARGAGHAVSRLQQGAGRPRQDRSLHRLHGDAFVHRVSVRAAEERADSVANEHTPVTRLAVWAFRGKNWHNVGNLGHVQFTGKPIAVRVEAMGWIPETQQAGVKLLVSNFSAKPVTLDAALELRKTDK